MSQEEGMSEELEEGIEWFTKWYHIPSVLALFVFALWTRARTWGNFVVDGTVMFSGNDAWYHLRQVEYTVRHWPQTMPYEIWTNFPSGTSVSQFGTIYDQVVATVALIVGLGNPDQTTVRLTLLFAPAVIGAGIVPIAYYLGKRVGKNRFSGIAAALIVALSSGVLLRRSLVGFSDHQVAEAFTQALAALAIVVALQVADSEKPIWELVVDRDVAGLRKPVGYAGLAGVATALYMWAWPSGVVFVGIFGLYVTIQAIVDHLRGTSPEPMLLVSGVVFAVTAVLMLLPFDSFGIEPVKFSLLQVGLAAAGLVWSGFLAGLSRILDERSEPVWTYPIGVIGALGVVSLGLFVLSPGIADLMANQLIRVFGGIIGQDPTGGAATIGEITPLENPGDTLYSWYGFVHIIAVVGVVLALARQTVTSNKRSELLFVSLWLAVVFSMTVTQVRFGYYLTVPVAVMAAYAIGTGFTYLSTAARRASTDVRPYQVMAVFTVLIVVMAPMVMATGDRGMPQDAVTQSNETYNSGPGGVAQWDSSLEWMSENTPTVGDFAGAGNDVDYWGEYAKTDDYEYEEGSYGVLSWWDYGHWITSEAERIPVANPFQQSATEAARFLLAQNESQADGVIGEMSDGENRDTRYVMVDWQMATGASKFSAPPAFVDGVSASDFVRTARVGNAGFYFYSQDYYDTMVNRLYRYHGSAQDPRPVVTNTVNTEETDFVETYQSLEEARQAARQSGGQVGGVGPNPAERVPALEHYRLVQVSDATVNPYQAAHSQLLRLFQYGLSPTRLGFDNRSIGLAAEPNPHYTKVFERVSGATIEGEGPAGANVTASVTMRMPNADDTFTYTQRAQIGEDGTFTMTVPYASTGAGDWGPEDGYTNTSVRATGPYQLRTDLQTETVNETEQLIMYNGTAHVTEGQVIGENDSDSTVELSETVLTERDLNETDGNGTNSTDGSETDDGTGGNTTDDATSDLVDPYAVGVEPSTYAPIAG